MSHIIGLVSNKNKLFLDLSESSTVWFGGFEASKAPQSSKLQCKEALQFLRRATLLTPQTPSKNMSG